MSSYNNRNQIRSRSRDSFDRRMDKWIETGKQVVDGVAGNRPGQARNGWNGKTNGGNFEKVGRWMEDKIDWFFEEEDDWLENANFEDENPIEEIQSSKKRPLSAISLRGPKLLPAQIDEIRKNSNLDNEWPDEKSYKLNQWERKDHLITKDDFDSQTSSKTYKTSRKRNLPKSNRRKY